MKRLKTLRSSLPTLPSSTLPTVGSSWRSGKTTAERGYGSPWQRASKAFLAQHPLCQCPDCDEGKKRITPSEVVDHHVDHQGDWDLFWDSSNWRALSKRCHDRKTQRSRGARVKGCDENGVPLDPAHHWTKERT